MCSTTAVRPAACSTRATETETRRDSSSSSATASCGKAWESAARWEGDDYGHKNRLIVDRLAGLSGAARRCRYVCVIALVGPDGRLHRARGELIGRVAERPVGTGGFGYDPIFCLPRARRTLAQLEPAEKNLLSHRGRAARRIRPVLERTLGLHSPG